MGKEENMDIFNWFASAENKAVFTSSSTLQLKLTCQHLTSYALCFSSSEDHVHPIPHTQ